jgi:hypothetical protein
MSNKERALSLTAQIADRADGQSTPAARGISYAIGLKWGFRRHRPPPFGVIMSNELKYA